MKTELWKQPKSFRKERERRIRWTQDAIRIRKDQIARAENEIKYWTHEVARFEKELKELL
jgi:hypothetical protein